MTAPAVATPETRRAALEMALEYAVVKAAVAKGAERAEKLNEALKKYLAEQGERELIDEETGRGVRLQERRGTPAYDVMGMREGDRALFDRLTPALMVNHKIAAALEQAGQVAGLEVWRMPGGVTAALLIVGDEP